MPSGINQISASQSQPVRDAGTNDAVQSTQQTGATQQRGTDAQNLVSQIQSLGATGPANKLSVREAYNKMFLAYLRTYARMGLQAVPMAADTGPIGGDLSHEFIILAETGESAVFCDKALLELDAPGDDLDYETDLQPQVDRWTAHYAATDEMHDPDKCDVTDDQLVTARGIEVGHIFYFGTKYSDSMGALVTDPNGEKVPVEMGSYGIGVSRLVAGIIEASHDDDGIIWPKSVAPFDAGLLNLRPGDEACSKACEDLYAALSAAGMDVLYDDRDERAGAKFANMDLIGLPWQVIVGPRGLENGVVELKNRATGDRQECPLDAVVAAVVDG